MSNSIIWPKNGRINPPNIRPKVMFDECIENLANEATWYKWKKCCGLLGRIPFQSGKKRDDPPFAKKKLFHL